VTLAATLVVSPATTMEALLVVTLAVSPVATALGAHR
jgi:hypothetical protein